MTERVRGFTLLEILIVVAIIGVLVIIALASYRTAEDRYLLDGDAQMIIESFDTARTKTLSREDDVRYGVALENNSIIEFQGTSYSSGNSSNKIRNLSGKTTVTTNGGTGSVYTFDPFTGSVNNTASIIITSQRSSSTIQLSVFSTGVIRRSS